MSNKTKEHKQDSQNRLIFSANVIHASLCIMTLDIWYCSPYTSYLSITISPYMYSHHHILWHLTHVLSSTSDIVTRDTIFFITYHHLQLILWPLILWYCSPILLSHLYPYCCHGFSIKKKIKYKLINIFHRFINILKFNIHLMYFNRL